MPIYWLSFILTFLTCLRLEAAPLLEQQVAFEGDEVTIRGIKPEDMNRNLDVSFLPQSSPTTILELPYRIVNRLGRKVLAVQLPLISTSSVTGSLVVEASTNEVLARLPMVIYQEPAGVDTHAGDDLPEVPSTVSSGLIDPATILAVNLSSFSTQVGTVSEGDSIKTAIQKLQGTKLSKGAFNYEQVSSPLDIGALVSEEISVLNINVLPVTSTGANTTISRLIGGVAGQIVTIVFKSNNISVRDKAGGPVIDSINIAGTGVQIFNSGDVLRLLYVDSRWVEIARSVN